jgi:NADH dehydrogenase
MILESNKSQNDLNAEEKEFPHKSSKRIVILGSGFAGVQVLKRLQNKFKNNDNIEITMISRDNFLLFTPMLPEVASGMIETRHIITPIRSFCNKANFYEANVESIDLNKKEVLTKHSIGRLSEPNGWNQRKFEYDYLVITLGSQTKFFGMKDVEQYSFTMKSIEDAISIRNHILSLLEQANLEKDNRQLAKQLLTFVIVGGGFNGVETVGEINDFVRQTIKGFYKNIYMSDVRVILINAGEKILEQVDEELGEYALKRLKNKAVEFIMNTDVVAATPSSVKLKNGLTIPCYTVIWAAGITPTKLIADLACEHDKGHRLVANNYLEIPGYENVFALGDCASIFDPHTKKPYPPTAQHAIKQGEVAAKNIIYSIDGNESKKIKFDYQTKGMMAEIGKRTGVATIFGIKVHGFMAWWLWRTYYLAILPTSRKKLKILSDWTMDLIYKPDVAMIKKFIKDEEDEQEEKVEEQQKEREMEKFNGTADRHEGEIKPRKSL